MLNITQSQVIQIQRSVANAVVEATEDGRYFAHHPVSRPMREFVVEVLTGYLNEWEADIRRQSAAGV